MTNDSPEVLTVERVGPILDGVVQSRSDERRYVARFVLEANILCSCNASIMRDSRCVHLRALLESLDANELREFILAAQVVPT